MRKIRQTRQKRKFCKTKAFPCKRRPGAMAQVKISAISQSPTRINIFLDSRFTGILLRKTSSSRRWIYVLPNGEVQAKLTLSRLRPKIDFLFLEEQPQWQRPWNHSIMEWSSGKNGIRWVESDHSLLRVSGSQVMYPALATMESFEPINHRGDPMDMTVRYRRCNIAPIEDDICVIVTAIMARYLWSRKSPNWLCTVAEYLQCFASNWWTKNIEVSAVLQSPPLPPALIRQAHR